MMTWIERVADIKSQAIEGKAHSSTAVQGIQCYCGTLLSHAMISPTAQLDPRSICDHYTRRPLFSYSQTSRGVVSVRALPDWCSSKVPHDASQLSLEWCNVEYIKPREHARETRSHDRVTSMHLAQSCELHQDTPGVILWMLESLGCFF